MASAKKLQKKQTQKKNTQSGTYSDLSPVNDIAFYKKIKFRLALFVAAVAIVLYAHSVSFDYVYDDKTVILQNKIVQGGVDSIGIILKSDYWFGFIEDEEQVKEDRSGVIYRPVSLVMFAIEWELFPKSAAVNHLVNVLFYAATCFLLFLLLTYLFKGFHLAIPFACALLYTVHPIHTEVVSNIKSRDEIMCMFFGLLSAFMLVKYGGARKLQHLLTALIAFLLSLLSKETGITFLLCIPLVLFFSDGFYFKKYALPVLGLVACAGLYFFIRAQIDIGVSTEGRIDMFDNIMVTATTYSERLGTAFYILLRYLVLNIFPHPLVSDYSYAQLEIKTFSDPVVLFSIAIHLAAAGYVVLNFRKRKLAVFGILFYAITIAPVSNILFLVGSNMAERFLYIPSLGICILLTIALKQLIKAGPLSDKATAFSKYLSPAKSLLIATAIICFLFSIKTVTRSSDWKSDLTLFSQDVKHSPKSSRLHYGYGAAIIANVDSANLTIPEIDAVINEGKAEIETALSIYPSYANAYYVIGIIHKDRQQYPEAISNMLKAKAYYPTVNPVFYKSLGYVYLKNGEYDKSISALDSFLLMRPATAAIYNNKGTALFGQAKYNEALQMYFKADSLNKNDSAITKNIGRCYAYLQQYDSAEVYFRKTIQLEPNNSSTYRFLGYTFQLRQDTAKANEYFRQADSIDAASLRK